MVDNYVRNIIDKFEYSEAKGFYYFEDIPFEKCMPNVRNVLLQLKPLAVYMVQGRPFVSFFYCSEEEKRRLAWKIWNAQLDIAICISKTTIEIYNGNNLCLNQMQPESLEKLDISEKTDLPFSYFKIKDEKYLQKYEKQLRRKNTLNTVLLDNIKYVTDILKETYHIPHATQLVLRIIFVRYMIDRGVDIGYPGFGTDVLEARQNLIRLCEDREKLYDFFSYLKKTFNGNLFELADGETDKNTDKEALRWLAKFLSGREVMSNGQRAFIDLYDFNIIPVELISNIYEIVLGETVQKNDKAFYTPAYLADYIIEENCQGDLKNAKLLDPSCGSGIFLVLYYRKIVETRQESEYSDEYLISTMKNNIYGIDKNADAVCVAIFSLYLTILDYKNPKELAGFKFPDLLGENIICADCFDDEKVRYIKKQQYAYIIGNPPWGRVPDSKLHMEYCKKHHLPQQNEEISRSFLYRVKDFCDSKTRCAFVLPSKLLYNQQEPAKDARKYMLSKMHIRSVTEMSSVVTELFENAAAPAMIMSFQYHDAETGYKEDIEHISFKPSAYYQLFHIIVIDKNDVKYVPTKLLLEYDWLWKTLVYGNTGDFENIKRLKKRYKTIEERLEAEETKMMRGTGVQYNDGNEDATELVGRKLFKPRKNIDHFYLNDTQTSFDIFEKKKIHRTRDIKLYQSPYCFLAKGVDPETYKMRAVCYEGESFVFPETIYGICGNKEQTGLLYVLAGLFNSSLYAYYNFMTGASMGIDRRQRFVKDVLRFPFPEKNLKKIEECSRELHQLKKQIMIPEEMIEKKQSELDEIVADAFGMKDNVYFKYAIEVMIPMIAGNTDIGIERTEENEMYGRYAKIFYDYFADIYEEQKKFVHIKLYTNLKGGFAALELMLTDNSCGEKIEVDESECAAEIYQVFYAKYNDVFYKRLDHYWFEENRFFIVKAAGKERWHEANAYMDIAEVTARILSE